MSELFERIRLAWQILTTRDSGLTKFVREEIGRVDKDVVLNCTNVARVFQLEGHSGGSAPIAIGWIGRALSWQPIAPLTGENDEWVEVGLEFSGKPLWQNRRCPRVFKEEDSGAWDYQGRVFRHSDGTSFINKDSRVPVTFPYHPKTEYVDVGEDVDGGAQ